MNGAGIWKRFFGQTAPRREVGLRPFVEELEPRWVLSPVITVNTTVDDPVTRIVGQETLRDAINDADASPGSTIQFNIPTTDPGYHPATQSWLLQPTSPLPSITANGVSLLANSQPGGVPGRPAIVLDGSNAPGSDGLDISASNVLVSGLDLTKWFVGMRFLGANDTVSGNFIGTDVTGTTAQPNSYGVVVAPGATGTAILNNVISGNTTSGVWVDVAGTVVQGNLIGTGADGVQPLGNGVDGVFIIGSNTTVGGTGAGQANTIAFNGGAGVNISSGSQNTVTGNAIYGNATAGIQLAAGANNNQLPPTLTSGVQQSGGTLLVSGTVSGAANTQYRVEFFANPPGANPQGQYFLGAALVTTDGTGTGVFSSVALQMPAGVGDTDVTATATDPSGNTSQFSAALFVPAPPPSPSPSPSPTPSPSQPPAVVTTGSLNWAASPGGFFNLGVVVQPLGSDGQPVGPALDLGLWGWFTAPELLSFFNIVSVTRDDAGDVSIRLDAFGLLDVTLNYSPAGFQTGESMAIV